MNLLEAYKEYITSFLRIDGTDNTTRYMVELSHTFLRRSARNNEKCLLQIDICGHKFEDLKIPSDIPSDTKWFSILDSFGSKALPLNAVEKYIGQGKQAIITVMSRDMNRFKDGNHKPHIAKMFGIPETKVTDITEPNEGRDWEESARNIAARYMTILKKRMKTKYALQFEMHSNKNSILYHLVFITHDLADLRLMKRSMRANSHPIDKRANLLNFSDFFYNKFRCCTLDYRPDPIEAILENFSGSRVLMSEVELFVLNNPKLYDLDIHDIESMIRKGIIIRLCDAELQKVDRYDFCENNSVVISDIEDWTVAFRDEESQTQIKHLEQRLHDMHLLMSRSGIIPPPINTQPNE